MPLKQGAHYNKQPTVIYAIMFVLFFYTALVKANEALTIDKDIGKTFIPGKIKESNEETCYKDQEPTKYQEESNQANKFDITDTESLVEDAGMGAVLESEYMEAIVEDKKLDDKGNAKINIIPWWVRSPREFSYSSNYQEENRVGNGLFVFIVIGLGRALIRRLRLNANLP